MERLLHERHGSKTRASLDRLNAFWDLVQASTPSVRMPDGMDWMSWMGLGNMVSNMATVMRGIPDFFTPNLHALQGLAAPLGVEAAAYYSTEPLRATLRSLVDFEFLCQCPTHA